MLSRCILDCYVDEGAFVIRVRSLSFSLTKTKLIFTKYEKQFLQI